MYVYVWYIVLILRYVPIDYSESLQGTARGPCDFPPEERMYGAWRTLYFELHFDIEKG